MEQLPAIQSLIEQLDENITNLEEKISPFLENDVSATRFDSPLDQASYSTALAYALISILFSYLKATGEDTNNHPIMEELERVKSYMAKVKKAKSPQEPGSGSKVDKEAAKRFIRHAIGASSESKVDVDSYLSNIAQQTKGTHKRFSDDDEKEVQETKPKKKSKKTKRKE
ncbi:exosome complex protein Lrp1p [Trichomonascus vanleenenianus]|uniref:Lrp1p n=1 Tax=Trichomonascus vanleenenianus TaxID=2268995 RepID=UPI003ECB5536